MTICRNFAKFQENAEIQHFPKSFLQFCANAQRKSFCIVQKKSAQATSTGGAASLFLAQPLRAAAGRAQLLAERAARWRLADSGGAGTNSG